MSRKLDGRVAVVTGGASGIGFACASWLCEQGARVFSCDYDPTEESQRAFAEARIVSLTADVRIESDVRRVVETARDRGGRLDILVHSAGVGCVGRITDVREDDWDRCLDTNLKGAFLFTKHAIPAMAPQGGAIVYIASNAGILPRPHDPVYCVSKAGLIMLMKAVALGHAHERIRVNAVCPGPVSDTRMMDRDIVAAADPQSYRQSLIAASPLAAAQGRMITPSEVAQAVGYLVSDEALMVTGTLIAIDGGKSLGLPPACSEG